MNAKSFLYRRRIMKIRKFIWRVTHPLVPNTAAVFILGVQRSGTTMLTDCFNRSFEFDVFPEISDAMLDFRIKEDSVVRSLIAHSHHKFAVFKPLTDSHRAKEFLMLTPGAYVIWMFRRIEDRANSAVIKSGTNNLKVLRGIADGSGLDQWQALGISEQVRRLVSGYDYSQMTKYDAAALLWYVRNSLFFTLDLDKEKNVLPLAYEDLVSNPLSVMRSVCSFLGANFEHKMVSDIHARSVKKTDSQISEAMREKGQELYDRLHALQSDKWMELGFQNVSRAPSNSDAGKADS